ncbi:hypothetical protein GCM10025868_35840 [Angustibacter aerolatus]|uniref:Uncharacterized protein n=1 Tax=Angustibacter aerolatus TaxID=1162965 RepID=A0ABQ6JKC8_9ACTN|nr:hypothetical protein [Angustibacter aerolatus]GMA88334.1 hypothetical protein GCM10025868_35840 [Angustibacter aerolatus]
MTATPAARARTAVDELADAHLDAEVALDPIAATAMGVPGDETEPDRLLPRGARGAQRACGGARWRRSTRPSRRTTSTG